MSLSALFTRPLANKSFPLLPLHASQTPTPYQPAPATLNLTPPFPNMTDPGPHSDALLALSRQETHLQSTLQALLDAQSEGLLAGLGGANPAHDDASSTGSRTPTTAESMHQPHKPKSVIPVRQPARKKVGLQGARRGIARAISDLANLKSEEDRVLNDEVAHRESILSTVSSFEQKSTGLREQIRGIQSEESSLRVEHLEAEKKTLANSIHDLETQLYEMKARHGQLIREIDGLNNSVQSKLSSYESALALAERDMKRFLARPPVVETSTKAATTGIWALPKERRTLAMVGEHYSEEQQKLKTRSEAVRAEGSALEEGQAVWEDVVQEVNRVEKSLRGEMQRMQSSSKIKTGEYDTSKGMETILQTMRHARTNIESKLDLAERNKWRLLVCCIGAELEALIEGEAVLEGAIEASSTTMIPRGISSHHEAEVGVSKALSNNGGTVGGGGGGPLIDDSASTPAPAAGSQKDEGEEVEEGISPVRGIWDRSEDGDEDEGPGMELLVSRHGG
jgi:hypothetical protein